MRIVSGTLSNQPQEFIDMVSNVRVGDIYIYSYPSSIIFSYDELGNPQPALFLVEEVEEITTRFNSRDRILRGWRGKEQNGRFVVIERTSVWCSQLADTERFDGECEIIF